MLSLNPQHTSLFFPPLTLALRSVQIELEAAIVVYKVMLNELVQCLQSGSTSGERGMIMGLVPQILVVTDQAQSDVTCQVQLNKAQLAVTCRRQLLHFRSICEQLAQKVASEFVWALC